MKLFITLGATAAFSIICPTIMAELHEKQLAKGIKLQYVEWERTGDKDKFEITIKDPHVYWLDGSAMVPRLIGEVDHKGVWKISVDVKAGSAKADSDGVTHVTMPAPEGDEHYVDFTLAGQLSKSMTGDLEKMRLPLQQMREGEFSEESLLTVLEAIGQASLAAKNLNITSSQVDGGQTTLEMASVDYRHASGEMPEEFVAKVKATGTYQLVMGKTVLSFPELGKWESVEGGQLALSSWRSLAAFFHRPFVVGPPSMHLDTSSSMKSKFGSSAWNIALANKRGENSTVDWSIKGDNHMLPGWVKAVMAVQKNASNQPEESQSAFFVYNWLTSAPTANFLSLLPMQSNLDWKGSLNYGQAVQGSMSLNWLKGADSGLQVKFDGLTSDKGDLHIGMLGGRATFDYFIDLYNAFEASLTPVVQKYHINLEKISPETKEKLFNFLQAYADDPAAQDKALNFTVRYINGSTTIGNKDMTKFIHDFDAIFGDKSDAPAPPLTP